MADSVAAPSGGDGTGAWEAAAQPAASAQPTAPAQPAAAAPPAPPAQPGVQPSESAPSNATLPKQPTPDAPVATPPVVLKPNKPGGLAGIMDGMLNVLTGTTKPETATGSDGQTYVKQQTLTRGEQWMRIGEEALHGAGAGWAAGRGRNPGAALAAGVQQGDIAAQQRQQQQNDAQGSADKQNAQARQAKLDQFNFVKLQQENAARAFDLKTAAVKGTRDDIDFAQKQDALYKSEGYADMGVATDPGHLADTQKDNPDFWKDVYAGKIVQNKEYDDEGNVTGVHLWHTANNDLSQLAPKGAPLTTWQPPANPNDPNDKGKFVQTPTSGDYTKGALQAYAAKAESDRDAYVLKQANLAHTAAETAAGNATASEAPSKIRENNAEANEHNAAADKARTLAADDPQIATMGEALARGSQTEDQIPGFSKNKTAIEAYLAQHHPNLDQSSVVLTGNERKQRDLANNAIHNLDDIATRLQRRPDLIGKINGLVSKGKDLTGTDDRDLADINTALDNYGLASTGAHGVRAVQARADAKKALLNGFKNGPQGVDASLQAARGSLQNLASVGKPRSIDGTPYVYKQQGGGGQQSAPATAATSPQAAAPPARSPVAAPAGAPAGAKQVWHDPNGNVVGYTLANGSYQSVGGQ